MQSSDAAEMADQYRTIQIVNGWGWVSFRELLKAKDVCSHKSYNDENCKQYYTNFNHSDVAAASKW